MIPSTSSGVLHTISYVCSRADCSADPSASVLPFCLAVLNIKFQAILGVSWLGKEDCQQSIILLVLSEMG